MRRFELTDEQYALLEPFLPTAKTRGRPRANDRKMLNGMFWKLATGVAWRDIPERYGPWQTVFERFTVWRNDGTLAKVVAALQEQLEVEGQLDWVQFNIDGTTVRASRAAGGARKKGGPSAEPPDHALGRSRGGFGTKLHLLCDGNGVPLAVRLTGGQAHESTQFESVLDSVAIRRSNGQVRRRPQRVAADKAYDVPRIRRSLRERGIQAVIPPKTRPSNFKPKVGRPVTYNKQHYCKRNVIERCVGWLKVNRSLATRNEKLAVNYLALVHLAFIKRYLRLLAPAKP